MPKERFSNMSRLNKLQIYSIRWLHSQNKDSKFIANDLELTEKQVTNAIEKFGTNSDTKLKTATSKVSKNLMISETSNKKSKNVSIMTKEASMQNDAVISKHNKQTNNAHNKYIFRPKK
jgi:hypothetical protein